MPIFIFRCYAPYKECLNHTFLQRFRNYVALINSFIINNLIIINTIRIFTSNHSYKVQLKDSK